MYVCRIHFSGICSTCPDISTLLFRPFNFTISVYRLPLPRKRSAIFHSVSPCTTVYVFPVASVFGVIK